jgi:4-hydroxymandelate oxidase
MGTDMTTPLPPLTTIPPQIAAVDDYVPFAQARLDPAIWAWLSGGTGDEQTLQDNREAFGRLRLKARALADVQNGSTRLDLLGQSLAHPILVAPVAYQRLLHTDGERATALGASALHAPMVLSHHASTRLEEVAAIMRSPLWLQLYLDGHREQTVMLLGRAEAAGVQTIVVTVDTPVAGVRNREQRASFALPPSVSAVNLLDDRSSTATVARAGESPVFASGLMATMPSWDDLAWLRAQTRLPLVIKGLQHPDDAARAEQTGMDAVVVSNHGGRALDGVPASIDVLTAVVDRVSIPVLVDGGIRRGTDIVKALALGARAVLIGRGCMNGLAAAGAIGVAHVLHILRTELEMAMVLTGCRDLASISREVIWSPHQAP